MIYRYIERGELDADLVGSHWCIRARDVVRLARRRVGQANAIEAGFAAALDAGSQTERTNTHPGVKRGVIAAV